MELDLALSVYIGSITATVGPRWGSWAVGPLGLVGPRWGPWGAWRPWALLGLMGPRWGQTACRCK